MKPIRFAVSLLCLCAIGASHAAPVTFAASGAGAGDISMAVSDFRAALGAKNPNEPGSFGSGRREIDWDAVPDARSAPNNLPADFFNATFSPRARGVVFATPGSGFQVSADSSNPTSTPVRFGQIDPTYTTQFATFSAERLFTALGSNITDVSFFVPGSTTPASVSAFGAVFTDVDLPGTTLLSFFAPNNDPLGTFAVPNAAGDATLSFLGVEFTTERIGRVRITAGNQALSAGPQTGDTVAMDDFIYSEPIAAAAVPEPATLALVATGLALAAFARRRGAR